jgi:hypothetical protein
VVASVMRKILSAVCLMLLLAVTIKDQGAKPDLSGTWNLDLAKSDFAGAPAPDSMVQVIEHIDSNLFFTTSVMGDQLVLTY